MATLRSRPLCCTQQRLINALMTTHTAFTDNQGTGPLAEETKTHSRSSPKGATRPSAPWQEATSLSTDEAATGQGAGSGGVRGGTELTGLTAFGVSQMTLGSLQRTWTGGSSTGIPTGAPGAENTGTNTFSREAGTGAEDGARHATHPRLPGHGASCPAASWALV